MSAAMADPVASIRLAATPAVSKTEVSPPGMVFVDIVIILAVLL